MTKSKTVAALLAKVREFADAESRYQREADLRAATESALETLEGQATLAEERAASLANELAEARGALSFARTVHARQRRWIIWGKLRRERDRRAVRRLRRERAEARRRRGALDAQGLGYLRELDAMPPPYPSPPRSSPGEDLSLLTLPPGCAWVACDCGCGGWLVTCDGPPGLLGRTEPSPKGWRWLREHPGGATGWQYVTPSDAAAARLELAASVRRAFVTETPDHCSKDHASPSAFRALSPQACSGAGDQPCTGEQSSPEPEWMTIGELVCAVDADGRELGQNFDGLDPCSPAQPARPIRAGQGGRGAGRFPRGGGRPGVSAVSPRGVKGIGGNMYEVAKAGPSPADRESAVNQGERARLGNPECATGALADGPEPEAGAREGWFGTVGEGERADPGGALRVAVAVLGAVDLVWWLCVRLLYLCSRRADEEPGRPGARYLGIGWQKAPVDGGALCEAWIGFVPVGAEPRDGWPVAWRWDRAPLEPPGWALNPDFDDRAPEEPGSIGILVRGEDGRARLAFWATAWGDRWTAPGFDAARLVRLLRAEITDAELRAEERDDEDDPDEPAPELSADGLPELPEGYTWSAGERAATISDGSTVVAGARGEVDGWWDYAWVPPGDESLDARAPSRAEALRTLAALAWQKERRELVADERPPATCRTGQEPTAGQALLASLPFLPNGYEWHLSAAVGELPGRATVWHGANQVAELSPFLGATWQWLIQGEDRLGPPGVGHYPTRPDAAARIARELGRRDDEAATREGLERQAEGGQS